MNERIQELAYQAEDYADSIVDQGGEFHPAYTQKFAELIVEEFRGVLKQVYLKTSPEQRECLLVLDDKIEEHFGVEE